MFARKKFCINILIFYNSNRIEIEIPKMIWKNNKYYIQILFSMIFQRNGKNNCLKKKFR